MGAMTAADAILPDGAVDWAVAGRPLAGQHVSGDLHVVLPFPSGLLVAAIDGLGHGPEAATAAGAAAAALTQGVGQPVEEAMRCCHEALRRTRGAALSLARFDLGRGMLAWLGIGNVDKALFRASRMARPARESLLLRGGLVGFQLPTLRAATHELSPGDTLVLATDGVSSRFAEERVIERGAQEAAEAILARHGKTTDDALVLVVRYNGGRS
jgi:negative regulator of sigma-B (phosphoserine phosphatase)